MNILHQLESSELKFQQIRIRSTPEMFIPQTTSPWFTYLDWLRC